MIVDNWTRSPKELQANSPWSEAKYNGAIDPCSLSAKVLIVLASPNKLDRKGNNKSSKWKLKKNLFGEKKRKKNLRISLLDDY